MNWRLIAGLYLVFSILTFSAEASGLKNLYDRQDLSDNHDRYLERINELFRLRLWSFFTSQEQVALSKVQIRVPLIGASKTPFDFYSSSQTSEVVMPVISLKFVEDLSLVYAWLYTKRYRLEPIDEYVAMLRYKPLHNFPGNRYPPPLEALGVPDDGWQDPKVKDLYLRLRNEAWAFILLHELGHVIFRHPGNLAVNPDQSQRNEIKADSFAIDVLKRTQTIPMGMILWFQATAPWFPNRTDYRNNDEFKKAVATSLTHPVSPERLRAIALHMTRWSKDSRDPTYSDTLIYIGRRLELIAEMLADPDMQIAVAALAQRNDLASLKPRR